MSVEANKAAVARCTEELWHLGNLDVADRICTANLVSHDPASREVHDLAGFRQNIAAVRAAFPDLHFTIEDVIAQGDRVACRWTFRGTHQARIRGIEPTGRKVTFTGISVYRLVDGKIAEVWNSWNALGYLRQLGALPA